MANILIMNSTSLQSLKGKLAAGCAGGGAKAIFCTNTVPACFSFSKIILQFKHLEMNQICITRAVHSHSPTQCSKPRKVIGMVDSVPNGDDLVEAFHLDAQNLQIRRGSVSSSVCVCAVLL